MTEDVSVVLENLMLFGAGGIPEDKQKHTRHWHPPLSPFHREHIFLDAFTVLNRIC